MKQRTLRLRPRGLVTNPSELSAVPEGALREAENVVIRRDGLVEPRPGFKVERAANANESHRFIVPLSDNKIVYSYDTASTPRFRALRGNDFTNLVISQFPGSDVFDPPAPFFIGPRGVEARGSTYLTHFGSTLKWDRSSSTLYGAGLLTRQIFQTTQTGSGQALEAGKNYAYRICIVREDPNGYKVRSAPSRRVTLYSTSASDVRVKVFRLDDYQGATTIAVPTDIYDGDVIEVYRSRGVDGVNSTPEDELFLAASVEYTTSGASTETGTVYTSTVESVSLVDTTPENELGAALYTNPSQQGALSANLPPPISHDMVSFRRSMFYFNLKRPYSVEVEVIGDTDDLERFTGDTVLGTNTILNMATGTAVVGNYINGGLVTVGPDAIVATPALASVFPAGTTVTNVVGTTVTVSANATATGTGTTFNQYGRITVDGVALYYSPDAYGLAGSQELSFTLDDKESLASGLAGAINENVKNMTATVLESDGGGRRSVLIEYQGEDQASFTVTGSESGVFYPEVTGSGITAEQEERPSGFAWSKTDLPEAVPIENYAFVGETNETILGAKAMRDSIMVWTDRGVYRISRYAEEPPRVDVLDPTLRCLAPNTIQVLENICYAWTNRGVVAVTEGGTVTEISDPFIPELLESTETELAASLTTSGSPSAAAIPLHNEYVFSLAGAAATGTSSSTLYVWNAKTRSWCTWTGSAVTTFGMAYDETNRKLLLATGTGTSEERTGDTRYNADASGLTSLSGISGTTVTSSVSLSAGDALEQSGVLYTVLTDGTTVTVSGEGLLAGTATYYRGFTSRVAFTGHILGSPDMVKRWQQVQWLFRSTEDLGRIQFEYTSDYTGSSAYTESYDLTAEVADAPRSLRHWVPRDHAWSARLYAAIEITAAGSPWKSEGVALECEVQSSAHRREAS